MRILWGIFRHLENCKSLKTMSFAYSRNLSGAPTWAGPGFPNASKALSERLISKRSFAYVKIPLAV